MKSIHSLVFSILISLSCCFSPVIASLGKTDLDLRKDYVKAIEKLTILDGGRLKPFDTYARNKLLQFSGRSKIKADGITLNPSDWLSYSIFEVERVETLKLFIINNPEIARSLDIEEEKKRHYSYASLRDKFDLLNKFAVKAFQKKENERDLLDKEFIRVSLISIVIVSLLIAFLYFKKKNL